MITTDAILATAGYSTAELDSTVSRNREFTAGMQLILADHFPVEDMAAGLQLLASRLAAAANLASGYLNEPGEVGDLARAITFAAMTDVTKAVDLVHTHLGLPEEHPDGTRPILADYAVYGRPDLRLVAHTVPDLRQRRFNSTRYIVHLPSGAITQVPDGADIATHFTRPLTATENANA